MNRLAVLNRDRWTCLMPVCVHPCTRSINPALNHTRSPWAPTVDHIIQRSKGGTDRQGNLRAAHRVCNEIAALRRHRRRHVRRSLAPNLVPDDPIAVLGGQFPGWLAS